MENKMPLTDAQAEAVQMFIKLCVDNPDVRRVVTHCFKKTALPWEPGSKPGTWFRRNLFGNIVTPPGIDNEFAKVMADEFLRSHNHVLVD